MIRTTPAVPRPFNLNASSNLPGFEGFFVSGKNPDVGVSGVEDIWDLGGTYTFMTSAAALFVSSSDDNDDQLIFVRGLDADLNAQTSTVTLDGQTQVEIGSSLTWLRVNDGFNLSGTRHAGTVYIAETDTLTGGVPDTSTKIKSALLTVNQRTQNGFFTVPNGVDCSFWSIDISIGKGKDATVMFEVRPPGGSFLAGQPIEIYQNTWLKYFDYTLAISSRSDFRFTATSASGAPVAANATVLFKPEGGGSASMFGM